LLSNKSALYEGVDPLLESVVKRIILHVDIDYFYAQVEERENPSLKDKPVVVCVYSGRTEDSGAVSTTNYIARKLGVKSGMPIIYAKKILNDNKDAYFIGMRKEYYETVSDAIMDILREFADTFQQVSIDEVFLDVTQKVQGSFENVVDYTSKIKQEVRSKERLTCSIGVGPNKLIAKMASDVKKPYGLTVVTPEAVQGFLNPMPVGRLFLVGPKTEEKLNEMGVKTIGELSEVRIERLVSDFGERFGEYLYRASRGIDNAPVLEKEITQISRISTLKKSTRKIEEILLVLDSLVDDVHKKSLDEKKDFKSIGIIAIMDDLSIHTRTKTLEVVTDSLEIMKKSAKELFESFLEGQTVEIRRVGIKVSGLEAKSGQTSLTDFSRSK
jgi:DNA polymerase IV (DinB-like DNA polymerase)